MKRYRVMSMSFDSQPMLLKDPPADPEQLEQWMSNRDRLIVSLTQEFGARNFDLKLANYRELGPLPFSVLSYHNDFLSEIRRAFVVGSYYPALTGAVTLAERMLNHLLLGLRDSYKGTPEYKTVAGKGQIDNWKRLIGALDAWAVLQPGVRDKFSRLERLRNDAVHWGRDGKIDARGKAIEGIRHLNSIVDDQFGIAAQPWFITDVPGEIYLKRQAEADPFVKMVYIPNGNLVGPNHSVEFDSQMRFEIHDQDPYPAAEVTDEEFARLRREARGTSANQSGST